MSVFQYFKQDHELRHLEGKTFHLSGLMGDKRAVFSAYGVGLCAPNGYFGENWDAFNDCLLDLDWIAERDIHIVHHGLPSLSQKDRVIYLDILQKAVAIWADDSTAKLQRGFPEFVDHRLFVYFPRDLERSIVSCLAADPT